MEAGTNLKDLGIPVQLVVRIRPLLSSEERQGDLRISDNQRKIVLIEPSKAQGSVDDEYNFDYVYAEATFDGIYDRSIVPMLIQVDELSLPGFIDGVSCAIIAFGNSRSGKTFTIEGNPAATTKDGVIPNLIHGIFEMLTEKQSSLGGRRKNVTWRYQLSVQYVEIVDEKITDLLNPVRMDLDIDEQGIADGLGIKNAVRKLVTSEEELFHFFKIGQAARISARSEFGPLSERATSILSLELHQVQTQTVSDRSEIVEHLYSRFVVMDMAGAEKMAEDPTSLRIREGPTLNKGVLCLAAALRALAQARQLSDLDAVDWQGSKLTRLLGEVFCGRFRALCITTIPPAHYQANRLALGYARLLARAPCFPLVTHGRAWALLRRTAGQIHSLSQQLAAAGLGGGRGEDGGGRALVEVAELERALVEAERVRAALLEERQQLREKLLLLSGRVTQLLGEKAQVQAERMASEEERLRAAKLVVDLQLEQTAAAEQVADRELEMESRLLQQEASLLDLQAALRAQEARGARLEGELARSAELVEDLRAEAGAARANYSGVLSDLDAEKARGEELALELLNLVNARNALLRERLQAHRDLEGLQRQAADLQARLDQAQAAARRLEEQRAAAESSSLAAAAAAEAARLEAESARVGHREEMLGAERRLAERERALGEEALLLRREGLERAEAWRAEREALQERLHAAGGEAKQARRRAAELETELRERSAAEDRLRGEATDLRERLGQLTEDYRGKLRQYMASLADPAAARGPARDPVERMLQELADTHALEARGLAGELERARAAAAALQARNRRLYQAYRSVRYQLEDLAPAGARLDMLDEAGLDLAPDAPAAPDAQAEGLRAQLAALQQRLADQAEAGLRAAEERAREARAAQQAAAARDAEVARLEERVREAADQRGQAMRLQEQLLHELQALKALPHAAAAPPAPPPAAASGVEQDLRRQLDRVTQERDRLAQERDRLAQELERARAEGGGGGGAAELQRRVAELEQAKRALEERLRAAEAAAAASAGGGDGGKAAALEAEVGRLRGQVAQLQKDKAALEARLAAGGGGGGGGADHSAEMESLRAKVAKLEADLAKDDYKAMIADFASTTQQELEAEVSELQTKVMMLEQENSDLQDMLKKRK